MIVVVVVVVIWEYWRYFVVFDSLGAYRLNGIQVFD